MSKKLIAILIAALMILGAVTSCGKAAEDVVVLFTNDVHCGIEPTQKTDDAGVVTAYTGMGYAGVAAYEAYVKQTIPNVILADAGDAIQGDVIGTLSEGAYLIDIMNNVGYDVATLGNHEFDYGMNELFALADKATYDYVSCNFVDTNSGKSVYDAFKVFEFGGTKVAFVGVSTPESITKSTPTFFQDGNGNYIYGFSNKGENITDASNAFISAIQTSVDAATKKADVVIVLGHLGVDESSSPWTSKELIAKISGADVFIDGHSHSVLNESVKDKDGKDVLLLQTGTKLANLGELTISKDGKLSAKMVSAKDIVDLGLTSNEAYTATTTFVDGIKTQYEALVNTVVGKTNAPLVIKDPATGNRIVRSQETNLGDLCTDAYRTVMSDSIGKPVDVAFVNGGGIRAELDGDITYGDIISVHPYGNVACVIEVTGQQLWEALEWGSRFVGEAENGGFLQVSGLTYEIHTNVTPAIEFNAETSMFVKIGEGYTYSDASRVQNVVVGTTPLDLNATYTLASPNYMLNSVGDGYSIFAGCNILAHEVMIDNQVLINYIVDDLAGTIGEPYANPYGEGRIKIVGE